MLNDWNVKTKQFGQWWDALAARGVPRKIWLHQGPRATPSNIRRAEWLSTLNRGSNHSLSGIDTGVMRQPMADVETAPNRWQTTRTCTSGDRPGTLPPRTRVSQQYADLRRRPGPDC